VKNSTIHELFPITMSPTVVVPVEAQIQPGNYITGQLNLYDSINTTMFDILTSGYIKEVKSLKYLTPYSDSSKWSAASTFVFEKSGTLVTTDYLHTNFLPITGGSVGGTTVYDIVRAKAFIVEGDTGEANTGSDQWNAAYTNTQEATGVKVITLRVSTELTVEHNNKILHFETPFFDELVVTIPQSVSNGFNVAIMNTGPGTLRLAATALLSTGTVITTQYGGAYVYKDNNMMYAVGNLN
jgi:archaellum component FlaF (FlaF/FlaG flagellin family)